MFQDIQKGSDALAVFNCCNIAAIVLSQCSQKQDSCLCGSLLVVCIN